MIRKGLVICMGKPYPKEFKLKSVEEFLKSGLGPHEWCMKSGLNEDTFYGWVRNFRQYGTPWKPIPGQKNVKQSVVKLEITPQEATGLYADSGFACDRAFSAEPEAKPCGTDHPVCEIVFKSATIRIYDRIPSEILKEILSLAGGASC